jgi:UDPglucose--hexose-1-phosphate uridylyltransferase
LPEFRRNPLTGDWVLYAAERAARPNDFRTESEAGDCPFCPGNEGLTPPEILAGRPDGSPPNSPDWRWRIFPNKFPALVPQGTDVLLDPDWRPAVGRHQVLIETPRHDASLADLTREEVTETLQACKERISAFHREPDARYVLIFKNHGQGSGASLRHPHFQIASLPFVPDRVSSQLGHAKTHFERSGGCVCCEWMERERREGVRVIHTCGGITILAPYAGRFPGEAWIMPNRHTAQFEESSADTLAAAADALRNLVIALRAWAGDAPYNLVILTAPSRADCAGFFHWRMELIPRLTGVAGFEWATGIHVNQITPEEAARRYRDNWDSTDSVR